MAEFRDNSENLGVFPRSESNQPLPHCLYVIRMRRMTEINIDVYLTLQLYFPYFGLFLLSEFLLSDF